MDKVPRERLRDQQTAESLSALAEQFPELRRIVREFLSAALPGDEFWMYDVDTSTGLALVRAGEVVKARTYVRAYVPPPELLIVFTGPRPTPREVVAVRQIDPNLREKSIREVEALLAKSPQWPIGPFPSCDLEAVEEQCRALGLRTERM